MKVLLLAECNSVHTIKWALSLYQKGISIVVFSFGKLKVKSYQNTDIKVITDDRKEKRKGVKYKLSYLNVIPKLKKIILEESPDIVHAHYATSYGIIGALVNFHPFVLSVWGSDVFDFPKKSFLHKKIIKYNFKKADKILSTSHVMANEIRLYTDKKVEVTPFGINTEIFKPIDLKKINKSNDIIIGTVKALEKEYGVRYLIEAFKILVDKYPDFSFRLFLIGEGSLEKELKELVEKLKLEDFVYFKGAVPFSEVSKYHNMIDIFVALSEEESFGVAIIEASSCAVPVVVSDVGGLPEVVENGVTGFIVPSKKPIKAAEAIEKLVVNPELRINMGNEGRERVKRLYNWKDNVEQMINIYKKIIT